MRRLRGPLFAGALLATAAYAAPLSTAEIAKLCGEAEGATHCGRLVEAEQLKRLPGLAVRDGATLRVSLFPSGAAAFTDVESAAGGTSYALWDHLSGIDATVVFATRDDDASFVLLQRSSGRQTTLPAQPVLSPDRQRLATADFCETRCENRLVVWRVGRDGVARELEWRPQEAWSDAGVQWKDAGTLVVDYTPSGGSDAKTLERRLTDAGWMRR
jgi:hypothetical protein